MALKETWIDRTYDDYIVPKTINEIASAIIELEKNGESVIPAISAIEQTLLHHDLFINAEMPVYLGELRDLVNNAPKDADGNIIESASKESVDTMKALFPKDAEGNPKEVASKEDVMVEVTRLNLIESTNDGMKIYTPIENPESEPVENLPMLDSKSMAIVCKHTLPCSFTLRIIFLPTSSSWVSINGIRYTEANQDIVFDNVTGIVEIENPSNVPIQISNLKAYLPLKTDVGNIKAEVGNVSKSLEASILKGSASGTIVAMKDVSPIEHEMGVKARGKNLFDITNVYNSTHMDYRVEGNKLIIKRTNTNENQFSNIYFNLGKCKDFANKTLTISATNESAATFSIHLVIFDSNGARVDYVKLGSLTGNKTTTYTAIVPDNDLDDVLYCRIVSQETTITDKEYTISNIQIEEGTTATAYAPYVHDITQAKILKQGKNLFYQNETKIREAGGLSFNLTQGQSSFIVNGTSTASSSAKLTGIPLKAGTYSIAIYGANVISSDMDRIYLQYTDTSGKNVYVNNIVNNKPKTFTLPYDITARVDFVFAANSTYDNKEICIQIEEGSTATDYEPYIAPTEYDIPANGNVLGVTSIHPSTTLYSDTAGVVINVEYNRDINIAFKNLEEKITALSAAMI